MDEKIIENDGGQKMGIKHLQAAESYFKSNAKLSFSAKKIRTELGLNLKTASECLAYLLKQKKIRLIKGKWAKYQWIANECLKCGKHIRNLERHLLYECKAKQEAV